MLIERNHRQRFCAFAIESGSTSIPRLGDNETVTLVPVGTGITHQDRQEQKPESPEVRLTERLQAAKDSFAFVTVPRLWPPRVRYLEWQGGWPRQLGAKPLSQTQVLLLAINACHKRDRAQQDAKQQASIPNLFGQCRTKDGEDYAA